VAGMEALLISFDVEGPVAIKVPAQVDGFELDDGLKQALYLAALGLLLRLNLVERERRLRLDANQVSSRANSRAAGVVATAVGEARGSTIGSGPG